MVLSEIPDRFRLAFRRWSRMNHGCRSGRFPDANTEYFLYQTLIGAWPISLDRIWSYMRKAMREAKLETSWIANNGEYEAALQHFCECILQHIPFVEDMERFVGRINRAGRTNSLTQTLLKYTAPGMPDLYQGSELWDHSLVDPDNRRPVDYNLRQWMLGELKAMTPQQYMEVLEDRFEDGSPKMWAIYQSLRLRNERPAVFSQAYSPLEVLGPRIDHAIAYLRGEDVLCLGTRFSYKLDGAWGSTSIQLPSGRWTNRFTGEVFAGGRNRIHALLGRFPVGLLAREEGTF